MNKSIRSLALTFTLAAALLLGAAAAHAQTVITSLPYIINSPGNYVLNGNLNSSITTGNLITINVSNVTIDFQGYYIAGPVGNTSQTTYGVRANEQSNINLKNGIIAYCYYGIFLSGNNTATTNAVGELIDGMRVTYCTFVGISTQYCLASRIQNCQVSKIGGTTLFTSAVGIEGYLGGVTVLNNTVSTITGSGNTYGITATGSFARGNTINGASFGVSGGKYQDNLTLNCTTAVGGGTDAGGNN